MSTVITTSSAMERAPTSTLPKVAVLLATHNGRLWLPDQVRSILAQKDVQLTLNIADDASSDGTWSWLESELGRRPDVRLMRHSFPSGSAGANFRALYMTAEVDGAEYVALADQDDLWEPGRLRRAIDVLSACNGSGYSSAVRAFWPNGRTRVIDQSTRQRSADFLFEGAGQGCTFVLRASFFQRARAFCSDHAMAVAALHYHDWLVYLLARSWNEPWVFDPLPTLHYRQHGSNEIGARSGMYAIARRLQLIRAGWYRHQVIAASHLCLGSGCANPVARALADALLEAPTERSGRARARLALALLKAGRRRLSDRLMLVVAASAGWL